MLRDGHVLLRPRRGAGVRPLDEGEIRRTAENERGAQLFLVDAEPFAEAEPLVVCGHAGPEDDIVHHLADLAAAERPEIEDVRRESLEDRTTRLEDLRISSTHDQHRPALGGLGAARERHVEKTDAATFEALGEVARVAGRYGRAHAYDETRMRAGHDPVVIEHDGVDLLVETDDDHDEIALVRDLLRG